MTTHSRIALTLCAIGAAVALSSAGAQTPSLNRVMREKLDHSTAILGAVVTSDWNSLDRESRALVLAVRDPAWTALIAPEYLKQSDAFQTALQQLIEASARKDLDQAAKAQVSLTMSCVDCHRYLTRRRIAK